MSASVHWRAFGRVGLGSPATQLMRAVGRLVWHNVHMATRRVLFLYAAFASALILLTGCATTSDRVTPVPSEDVGATPTIQTTPTSTAIASFSPTNTAVMVSPTARDSNGMFPDVAFGVSTGSFGSYPLFGCRGGTLPGRVVAAQHPFGRYQELVADTLDSLYNPVWSPDGKWLAYIRVRKTDPVERIVNGHPILDYPDSDSVWVMKADGSDGRQISEVYMRQEAISLRDSGNGCDVAGGIVVVHGWSADSQWILIGVNEVGNPGAVIAVNAHSGLTVELNTDGHASVWAPRSLMVAALSRANTTASAQYVEIESIADTDHLLERIEMPLDVRDHSASDVLWDGDEKGLSVITVPTRGTSDTRAIWHYDLVGAQWEEVGAVRGSLINYFPDEQMYVGCSRNSFLIQSLDSGAVLKEIPSNDRINCNEAWIVSDDRGDQWVAFMTYDFRKVWFSSLDGQDVKLLLDLDKLGIEAQLNISGVSWSPIAK